MASHAPSPRLTPPRTPAERLRAAAFPVGLFAINAFICARLFTLDYIRFLNSIEPIYISMARYAADHWPHLSWWPLWYGGVPYQNTYPPLLHFAVAGVSSLFGLRVEVGFHAVVAVLYCLGPVFCYWMALRLSGSRGAALGASLAWSLVSPSIWLLPYIHHELHSLWLARRLQTLAYYGDSPHVIALGLVPLAVACLDLALHKRRSVYYVAASLAMIAVTLTNWVGAVELALAVVSYLLAFGTASPSAGDGAVAAAWRTWAIVLGLAALAYLIAMPWVPPSTVRTFQVNAETHGGDYRGVYRTILMFSPVLVAALALLKVLLTRLRASRFLQFALFLLLFTGSITFAAEAGVTLMAHPARFHLAMELAVCLAGAALAYSAVRRLPSRAQFATVAVLALLAAVQVYHYHAYAASLFSPIDIRQQPEYRTAEWVTANMDDERVMVSGGTSYWLNALGDTPQFSGIEQSASNWMARVALYTLYTGQGAGDRDGEISVMWLKAFGIQAIAVSGPDSAAYYKPYANPLKFEGLLPVMYRNSGETVYRVPVRSTSLAHAVLRGEVVARAPVNGLDVDPLRPYLAALDNPARPLAPLTWRGDGRAEVVATLKPEHLLAVQISYHQGWHASVNGRKCRTFADGVGLLVVEPQCNGPCTVELRYDGGAEMILARIASWTSIALCIAWIFFDSRRRGTRRERIFR